MDGLIAGGRAKSDSYFDLVRKIYGINESYGYAYIYYLNLDRGQFIFVLDTDEVEIFDDLNQTVEAQSESILSSSQLIEQMVKGIYDIQSTVQQANAVTEALGESSKSGKKSLEELTADLERITERSVKLEGNRPDRGEHEYHFYKTSRNERIIYEYQEHD